MHQQNVALGAPGDCLVDAPSEETIEDAVRAAADDDHRCVLLLGDVEQPIGRVADLGDELRTNAARRERRPCPFEESPRDLLGLRRAGYGRVGQPRRYRPRGAAGDQQRAGRLDRRREPRYGHRGLDADDHESRSESLGLVSRALERPRGTVRAVVAGDDGVHEFLLPGPASFDARREEDGVQVYRWIEHASELELVIEAPTEAAVFADALTAFAELVAENGDANGARHTIELEADDLGVLLVDWLNELVYLAEVEQFVPEHLTNLELHGAKLRATVRGRRGEPRPLVKAVTLHRATLERDDEAGWRARVVLDV